MQPETRTLFGGLVAAIEPGVDLAHVRHDRGATSGGRLAKRSLFPGRAQGARSLRLDRLRQARGLDPLAVETGLGLQLTGEGLAVFSLGAEALHFEAVLVSLIAVRVDRRLAGTRLPRLGLGHSRRHGEDRQDEERAESDHGEEDGACCVDLQAWLSAASVHTRVRLTAASSSSRVVGTAYSASRSKPSFGK